MPTGLGTDARPTPWCSNAAVIAHGAHARLMAEGGPYRDLWDLQASTYGTPPAPGPRAP